MNPLLPRGCHNVRSTCSGLTMSYWSKQQVQGPAGWFVKVTNGYGKSSLCKDDNEAEWLMRILKQHADKPEHWHR